MSRSLVQRNLTDCSASLCVIYKSLESEDSGSVEAVAPEKKMKI